MGQDAVATFINELYRRGGFESWAEFAKEADVLPSSLSNWQTGNRSIRGHNLVKLIWAAERRSEDTLSKAAAATDPEVEARIAAYYELAGALEASRVDGRGPPPPTLSATAAALMAEIREQLVDEFGELDARLARLEAAQAPAQTPQTRKRRAR